MLVLAANQIDVHHRYARGADALAQDIGTQRLLAHVVRRSIEHEQQLSAHLARLIRRAGLPHVFTDIDTTAHALDGHHAGRIAAFEIALLVKNPRIG